MTHVYNRWNPVTGCVVTHECERHPETFDNWELRTRLDECRARAEVFALRMYDAGPSWSKARRTAYHGVRKYHWACCILYQELQARRG